MNHKFTIVANPFTLPFEEVMLKISHMLPDADTFGFIGGTETNGLNCIAEEGKLFKAKPFFVVSDRYDTEDFDLSMHPSGWLVFDHSRTKIREFLFKIYKVLRADGTQIKFYRPHFDDYSNGLRVGWPQEEITIKEKYINTYPDVGRIFSGGGGGSGIYTVIPMPHTLSTFQILNIVMALKSREHIKYIITNNNYAYTISDSKPAILACEKAPIISFMKTHYDCLLVEGFPHQYVTIVCNELSARLENRTIMAFIEMDYRHVRSTFTNDGKLHIWLNVYNMMYDIESDVLSGSELSRKYGQPQRENFTKTVRISIGDQRSFDF